MKKYFGVWFPIASWCLMMGIIIIISCNKTSHKKEKPTEDDFLKTPKTETITEPKQEVKTYTPIYKAVVSSSNSTYWYVSFTLVKTNGNEGSWHRVIMLNAPYFDFVEARRVLELEPEVMGSKIFFEFFTQINKESYESFFTFKTDNDRIVIKE